MRGGSAAGHTSMRTSLDEQIMDVLAHGSVYTLQWMTNRTGASYVAVQRIMNKLVEAGRVERDCTVKPYRFRIVKASARLPLG